jgi:ESCRT-II complex subunit
LDFFKESKESILDVREAQNCPLFNNAKINRKLPQEVILLIMEDLCKTGNADPMDKTKNRCATQIHWFCLILMQCFTIEGGIFTGSPLRNGASCFTIGPKAEG